LGSVRSDGSACHIIERELQKGEIAIKMSNQW
jgi:hypothetical protein